MSSRGVIYYNRGLKMIVRLAVSIHSLRQIYDGPICLLSQGDDSHEACQQICDTYNVMLKGVQYKTQNTKGATFINATLSHEKTPFDNTLWIDSDTVVLCNIWDGMWKAAQNHEFAVCQISNWTVTGKIAKRLQHWDKLYPEMVKNALRNGKTKPAINCGLFAFTRQSEVMADWYDNASPALDSGITLRYPDEVCCQMMISSGLYPHKIMPQDYNVHCRAGLYDADEARMIHFCGGKSCRIGPSGEYIYHSDEWYRVYDAVMQTKIGRHVAKYIDHDRQLKNNLPKRKA